MGDGDRADITLDEHRAGIDRNARTRRRVARVADGDRTRQGSERLLIECSRDETHAGVEANIAARLATGGRNTRALLAAMLERIEAEIGDPGDIEARCNDAKNPTGFAR